MRRNVQLVRGNDRLAELSRQLPPKRRVHLDPGELAREQTQPDFHRLRAAAERELQLGLRGDTRGQRDRQADQYVLRDEHGNGPHVEEIVDEVQE